MNEIDRYIQQFPLDRPIPYDLIESIIKFRVAENNKKKEK